MGQSSIAQRVWCGVLTAAVHAGLLWCLQDATLERATATQDQLLRRVAPLLVTAFVTESRGREFRLVDLPASDLLMPRRAIVLSLPDLPSIDAVAVDSFEPPREMSSSEDVQSAQRLQGLYVGQIKARLLRLLESVGIARTVSQSRCLVHVVQDERGEVLDVISDECDGDAEWQTSIDRVIRQASPLPTPPQGLAMGSYLTLDLSDLR
jgi:hypothetical protein